jgi:hypothetical protein
MNTNQRKILFYLVPICGALALSLVFWKSAPSKGLFQVFEGSNICFQRATQTFTALMIGSRESAYLKRDFQSKTEECFAEVASLLEKAQVAPSLLKMGNDLGMRVHSFHRKVSAEVKKLDQEGKVTSSWINQSFQEVEFIHEEFLNEVSRLYDHRTEVPWTKLGGLGFLVMLLTGLAMWIMRESAQRFSGIQRLEDQAKLLNEPDQELNAMTVEEHFQSLWRALPLQSTKKLFTNFLSHMDQELINQVQAAEAKALPKVLDKEGQPRTDLEPALPSRQQIPRAALSVQTDSTEKVTIALCFDHVIQAISDKLFSQGVKFSIEVPEDLTIWASEEALEQVIYNLINLCLKSVGPLTDEKKISILGKKLGGAVYVEIQDNGVGMDPEVLDSLSLPHDEKLKKLGPDLMICDQFLKEFDAQLSVENIMDNQRIIKGSKFRLIFRGVALDGPQVKALVRGRKGDVQKVLNS